MNATVFKLFPTTVMEFDLRGYPNKDKLIDYINNSPTSTHFLVDEGQSSYGSKPILEIPEFKDLKTKMEDCIKKYSKYLNIRNSYITDSWFNLMENGSSLKLHNHGPFIVSGTYYPILKENTCNLIFSTPLYSSITHIPIKDTENLYREFSLPIKQDYLYLFPSWLDHFTEKNMGGKRIVVSFNTKHNIYDGLRN